MWVFEERGNRKTQRKTFRSRVENQQTQPTYDAESRNRTRATLVGSECSHHCAIPTSPISPYPHIPISPYPHIVNDWKSMIPNINCILEWGPTGYKKLEKKVSQTPPPPPPFLSVCSQYQGPLTWKYKVCSMETSLKTKKQKRNR